MIVTISTCLTEPREAPSDVKAYSISSSEIRVTWKPPNPGPGRPRGYEVHVNCFHFFVLTHTFAYSIWPLCMRGLRTLFSQSHSCGITGQLLERHGAGRVGEKTKNCEKRNVHGLDRTRGQQSVSHHCKRLQQHRPGSCHHCCHSQDQESPWVQHWH